MQPDSLSLCEAVGASRVHILGPGSFRHPHRRPGPFRQAAFPLHRNWSCWPGPVLSFQNDFASICSLSVCQFYGQILREQPYSPRNGLPYFVPLKCLQFFFVLDSAPHPLCFSEKSRNKGPRPRTGPRHVLSTARAVGPAHSRGAAPTQMSRTEASHTQRPPCPGDPGTTVPESKVCMMGSALLRSGAKSHFYEEAKFGWKMKYREWRTSIGDEGSLKLLRVTTSV